MAADFDAESMQTGLEYFRKIIVTRIGRLFSLKRYIEEILVVVLGLCHFVGIRWVSRAVLDFLEKNIRLKFNFGSESKSL